MHDETAASAARVALLYTRLDVNASNFDGYRPSLPPRFAKRLSAMRSAQARARSTAGYWLLERGAVLAGFGKIDTRKLQHDTRGRPVLPGGPGFSISHCADIVACALYTHSRTGLDVERPRPLDVNKFQRFLSSAEQSAAAADSANFFRAWTAREAVVKASGQVGLARIARVQVQQNQAQLDGTTFCLAYPHLGERIVACVANAHAPVQCWVRFIPAPA